jgi:predicted transcriptional regulator
MPKKTHPKSAGDADPLSRRERQIMDIVYAREKASARDIWTQLADPPSYATVRTILRVLLEKGHLKRRLEGRSYIYLPTRSRSSVARKALKRVLQTFYGDSVEDAVYGLLQLRDKDLSAAELKRIEALINEHKRNSQSS